MLQRAQSQNTAHPHPHASPCCSSLMMERSPIHSMTSFEIRIFDFEEQQALVQQSLQLMLRVRNMNQKNIQSAQETIKSAKMHKKMSKKIRQNFYSSLLLQNISYSMEYTTEI
jgi:hypothetical protein